MAGRGDKIWHYDTEVKPNYEKLDALFEKKGMVPEGYEEYKQAGKTATYSQVLRWTRAVGSGGAKPYVIMADFELDTGKVKALRRAGWTAQDIADDMGLEVEKIEEFLRKGEIREIRRT